MILIVCGLALAALAGALVFAAASRWWHYVVIGLAWLPLFPLVARHLTGDVSHYLPANAFSDGPDAKEEIILASAYATIVLAVMFAAAAFWAIRLGWQAVARRH